MLGPHIVSMVGSTIKAPWSAGSRVTYLGTMVSRVKDSCWCNLGQAKLFEETHGLIFALEIFAESKMFCFHPSFAPTSPLLHFKATRGGPECFCFTNPGRDLPSPTAVFLLFLGLTPLSLPYCTYLLTHLLCS
jgi:hypothetical protein